MKKSTVTGRLSCHRDGYGFVIPDDGGEDLFIPARYLRENMHGDRVLASVEPRRKSVGREGRIVETLERGCRTIVGRYESSGAAAFVVPDEARITRNIALPPTARGGARDGETVVVEITAYPSGGHGPLGRVVEVLGQPDDPEVEVLAIVRKHGLPHRFPADVLAAARSTPGDVTEEDRKGRVDLRGGTTVTIDGETARDFDDAVSVSREKGGAIRLRVSIADVSHYVKKDSPLDLEALNRGTSVYFPDRCIPMLPEILSNGICSLNPHEERLTVTAEMLFDLDGEMTDASFYPSVIRSDERLTYTEVREMLVDGNPDIIARYRGLVKDLRTMEELALRLREKRRRRGSIDFDLPEPEIVLDLQGRPESIGRAERNLAHSIIEEFMLAANEAVAAHITERGVPCLYRVHEPPDPLKLKDFRDFIKPLGVSFRMKGDKVAPGELQKLLVAVDGRPEEKMVNEVLLRCMKQARYAAENIGHFGLASPCYLHFTSPIRRYPDLVVHRILKSLLSGGMKKRDEKELAARMPDIAELTSRRERTAMEAEREIVDLKKLQYMEDRVGETFDGFITGVTSYGCFVELSEFLVEGLVHVSALGDDFYRLLEKQHTLVGERSGKKYRIGDRVRVRVDAVSRGKKRIELSPVEAPRKGAGEGRPTGSTVRRTPSAPGKRAGKPAGSCTGRGGKRR
jgi:ribonuclease R